MIKKRTSFLLALALTVGLMPSCSQNRVDNVFTENKQTADTTVRIKLLFAGDLMQHITQINDARQKDGSYNYDSYFSVLKNKISEADLAVANLEVTFGGKPYSGYPQFCAPDEYAFAIRDAGFDVLETANNHSVDKGKTGIERTITMLDSLKIPHFGTYVNVAEREKQIPFIVDVKGIKIAFLNYTYDTNGIPVPSPNIVNLIDKEQMERDIEKTKAARPDVIIACMHWGIEYSLIPSAQQKELADWLFEKGVDHIIGGHPHVVQPIELRQGKDGKQHFLAYSLGNFISNQSKTNTDGGLMVELTLEKDSTTRLVDCGYSLNWVSRTAVSGKRGYRILPISFPQNELNAEESRRMNIFSGNAHQLFNKYNVGNIKEITEY